MKAYLDNHLVNIAPRKKDLLRDTLIKTGVISESQTIDIILGWPTLLELIDSSSILERLPAFDEQSELYRLILSYLNSDFSKEQLFELFDQIFVEWLTNVKELPETQPAFLIEQIRNKKQSISSSCLEQFSWSLNRCEKLLIEHPRPTIHDLILYLAWDRVCVYLAVLFEHISTDPKFLEGLTIFKDCLLESFQHITAEGKSTPGFFRLVETLYAFYMREEKLQSHTETEWAILCQSALALKPRNRFSDIFYIDAALIGHQELQNVDGEKGSLKVLTMDSQEVVKSCIHLTLCMIEKIKQSEPNWQYHLCPVQVFCLKEEKGGFSISAIVKT